MGAIRDGEEITVQGMSQTWQVSWHPPETAPEGMSHGSAGICFSSDLCIVLVSRDGESWGFPGGRPEGNESWQDTLRREVDEEACARVMESRLLGFARSHCVSGTQEGLILVRAFWQTKVVLKPWRPDFEMPFRRVFPVSEVREVLRNSHPGGDAPVVLRVFDEVV